jgi:hypothetical protein
VCDSVQKYASQHLKIKKADLTMYLLTRQCLLLLIHASFLKAQIPPVCDNLLTPIYASKGLGNYFLEFKKYTALARVMGRRLCLEPFHEGKTTNDMRKWHQEGISNYYNLEKLGEYIPLVSSDVCTKCKAHHAHTTVFLNDRESFSINSVEILFSRKELRNVTRSVQLILQYGSLEIPFLIHGEMQANVPHYLHPPKTVVKATQAILNTFSHRINTKPFYNFTCFHWRFEETVCRNEPLGLCQRIDAPPDASNRKSRGYPHFVFSEEDVEQALSTVQTTERSEKVLLISDGHLRGRGASALVSRIKTRQHLLELGDIPMVKKALDYLYVNGFSHEEDVLPVLERELCKYAAVVIGTMRSSFSDDILDSQSAICNRRASLDGNRSNDKAVLNSHSPRSHAVCSPVNMNDKVVNGTVMTASSEIDSYPHHYYLQQIEESNYKHHHTSSRYYGNILYEKKKVEKHGIIFLDHSFPFDIIVPPSVAMFPPIFVAIVVIFVLVRRCCHSGRSYRE